MDLFGRSDDVIARRVVHLLIRIGFKGHEFRTQVDPIRNFDLIVSLGAGLLVTVPRRFIDSGLDCSDFDEALMTSFILPQLLPYGY